MTAKTPPCPYCGAASWDVYTGRDAHTYGGYSATCAKCWEYTVNLTFEELLTLVLDADEANR